MLIQTNLSLDKNFLIENYFNLIKKGIDNKSILFLIQNSYQKKEIINFCKKNNIESSCVNTFQGLIYRTINDNWDYLSSKIKIGDKRQEPNLCSMELSQYIMKKCIETVGFKDYFSKTNLLHQLFRRYYLILQNDLNDEEVNKRSKMLGEVWSEDAQKVFKKYEEKTLQYRSFDYLRQLSLFKYIYKNTDYFKEIKYLIVDNADEITEFEFNFIKYLAPQLKEHYIYYDSQGSSRIGYLSAKKNIEKSLTDIFMETPKNLIAKDFINKRANDIYNNFINEDKKQIEKFELNNFLTRLQMIKSVCKKVKTLLKQGIKTSEIAIIAPEIDFSLENFLKKYLPDNSYEFLSGNKKLIQDKYIKNFITILKLSNPEWEIKTEPFEINSILNNFLKIPMKYCQNIFTEYKKNQQLKFFEFENKNYENNYKKLLNLMEKIKTLPLSESIKSIQETFNYNDNIQVNFLLKQVLEFEYLFHNNILNKNLQKNIIKQFENSMIAENSVETKINTDKIIISSIQKCIDLEHKVKYQFWLDLSHSGWLVEDVGNIYNAWGFQADWTKSTFEYDDLITLTKEKTARMLRKLSLLTSEEIFGYSSCYDSSGLENLYGISDFLNSDTKNLSVNKQIIPRDDQKPVLEYKNGKCGIAAVPGAGKTTILLALVIKLLEQNIPAENIFVLTYMDSAAKHFKEKLLEFLPNLKTLPNISTIHGLCLRILKDNSNFIKIGLDTDFQVCDELNRKSFIFQALFKSNIKEEEFVKYEKAVSTVKLNPDINMNFKDKSLFKFKTFFNNYNQILKDNSMIDYDDMILYGVKLLEENPEILKKYQQICQFLIEDEAQDSSLIQQKLLTLLSDNHKNLIRCGDPNQAITSTFTSADTKGFVDFIDKNNNVKMNTSQRCAKSIYEFANQIMLSYPQSFFKNLMQGTKDNPKNQSDIQILTFEQDTEEKTFILNEINNILKTDKTASIAILLRNNYQVENYSEFLNSNKIKTFERIDNLKNNRSFNIILTFFEMLEYPYNNKVLSDGLKILAENNFYKINQTDFETLKSLNEPFINTNPEEFNSYELSKFWWDFNYIFSQSNQDADFLACLIADYYFEDEYELENAYMISMLIKSMSQNIKNEQTLIEKLKSAKNLTNLGFIHLLKEDKNTNLQTSVQVMTIHKSKGDEFDYIFVPEMSSKLFSLNKTDIKVSSENYFCECLKPKEKIRSQDELKQEQIDETLHLLYVATTRAKKQLYMSFSKNFKRGGKNLTPCDIFFLNDSCNHIKNSD